MNLLSSEITILLKYKKTQNSSALKSSTFFSSTFGTDTILNNVNINNTKSTWKNSDTTSEPLLERAAPASPVDKPTKFVTF